MNKVSLSSSQQNGFKKILTHRTQVVQVNSALDEKVQNEDKSASNVVIQPCSSNVCTYVYASSTVQFVSILCMLQKCPYGRLPRIYRTDVRQDCCKKSMGECIGNKEFNCIKCMDEIFISSNVNYLQRKF